MGRRTREKVLKIRYRQPGKVFRTRFVMRGNDNMDVGGRVLRVGKMSYDELNNVHTGWHPFQGDDAESVQLRRLVKA
jgi:hypothetical protein